jgi:hypothetical protein
MSRLLLRLAALASSPRRLGRGLLVALALLALGAWGNVGQAVAQDAAGFGLGSARRPVRVTLAPLFQGVRNDGLDVGQTTTRLGLVVPFAGRWTFSASTRYARSFGGGLTGVGGLDDAELSLTFAQRLGDATLVADLGARLPSGKQELSGQAVPGVGIDGELRTTTLTSQDFYGFAVGTFGEGFALKPSLTAAIPVGERLVLGAAVTVRYRAPYRPVAGAPGRYDPGNEVILSGGASVAALETTSVSMDLIYTRFGRDAIGDRRTVQAGRQLAVTTEVRHNLAKGYVRVVGRYQNQARSSVPDPRFSLGEGVFADQQISPSQGLVVGEWLAPVTARLSVVPRLGGRVFGSTQGAAFRQEAQQVADVSVTPTYALTNQLSASATGALTLGTFTGYQLGLQLTWSQF